MKYTLTATSEEGEVVAKIESSSLNIIDEEMYKIVSAEEKWLRRKMEEKMEEEDRNKYPNSFTSAAEEEIGVTPH